MPGIFQSLDIARRAIYANRLGLDVASHNIANVNTPGYTRQRANLKAALPLNIIQGQLGMGVTVESVTRARNQLLDFQFRRANVSLGDSEARTMVLRQLETVINEPSDGGIASLMNGFFAEFSNLASDPENTALRNTLVQKTETLVAAFHDKNTQILEIQSGIRKDTQNSVNQVNELTRRIADLNKKIDGNSGLLGGSNDLKDQRDQLLDKLSKLVDIRYSENRNGNLSVSANGINLVSGNTFNELSVKTAGAGNGLSLTVTNKAGDAVNIKGGKIGALLKLHNKTLPDIKNKLDNLAKNFVDEVNRLHRTGKTLPTGNPPTSATNIDFFVGTDSASIDIAAPIRDNVSNIAASKDGAVGNGDVAVSIANLRNRKVFEQGTQTLSDYYTNIINNVGTQIETAKNENSSQEQVVNQIQNQRDSESGVSLDEEMTNLIKFQRSLEASARVVRVVDDVLNTVINMV